MEYVRGISLRRVLTGAEDGAAVGLPVSWAASIAAQICTVLSYAHAIPVVHRDLKPDNVLIAADGTVKVLDFGIAKLLRSDVTRLTATGSRTHRCGGPRRLRPHPSRWLPYRSRHAPTPCCGTRSGTPTPGPRISLKRGGSPRPQTSSRR
jgi:serine/threonine protein kinase